MIGIIDIAEVLTMLSPDVDPDEGADVADVLPRKRQSPHYPSLLAEIRRDGITVPVVIDFTGTYPELIEGHHRIAAAVDAGLSTVPWSTVPLSIDT
ncbi:ParB N-terminal domain-containing protein [Streptomyces sp. NPDC047868]|uniref:ParB N-terminal domain-containing protein n=1 Tax=Streptomyces sp. NPDC047868 TaxID=3155480 RepID=UPI003454AF3D